MLPKEETITESLKCTLTDNEKIDLGEKQANDLAELSRLEDRLKSIKSQITSQMDEVKARIKSTAETIRNGYMFRDVECLKIMDMAQEIVRYYRQDTGECYRERGFMPGESATDTIERLRKRVKDNHEKIGQLVDDSKCSLLKEDNSEPLTQSTGETAQERPAAGQGQPVPPECDSRKRTENVSVPSVAGVAIDGTQEHLDAETPGQPQAQVVVDLANNIRPEDLTLADCEGEAMVVQVSTPPGPAPTFDADAQAFLDKATPLQREVILDPVKTRPEILASSSQSPAESPNPEPRKRGHK